MKALTLHRPWGASMLWGPKPIENRSWPPPESVIGEVIALHHGLHYDDDGDAFLAKHGWRAKEHEQSCWLGIIGTARVIGYVDGTGPGLRFVTKTPTLGDDAHARERRVVEIFEAGREFFFGNFGWVLDERLPFLAAIPCLGHQKLWNVRDLEEEIVIATTLVDLESIDERMTR